MDAAANSNSAWPCVEKQAELELEEEEEEEEEEDQLGRLPEEVVVVIVNKLFHLKTLIRFSLVAKSYSCLASQTHSLLVDLGFALLPHVTTSPPTGFLGRMGGFLRNQVAKLTGSTPRSISANNANANANANINPDPDPDPDACLFLTQKHSAITHRFPQIKYLHLHLHEDTSNVKPLGMGMGMGMGMGSVGHGSFSTWATVFGSHFEQFYYLNATSVNPNTTNYTPRSPSGLIAGLDEDWLELFRMILKTDSLQHVIIGMLVSKCKMVEAAMLTDAGGPLLMGKHQIARLREDMEAAASSSDQQAPAPAQLRVVVYHAPTLDLPKTGHTLKNALLVSVMPADQDAGDVEMGVELEDKPHNYDFDFEKWDVLTEAARLIVNGGDKWEKIYDSLHSYQQFLTYYRLPSLLTLPN